MKKLKTIAVSGATGRQGGAVVRHLLKSGEFRVRALCRNQNSSAAERLVSQGAEVVEADFDNSPSREKLGQCGENLGSETFRAIDHGNRRDGVQRGNETLSIESDLGGSHRRHRIAAHFSGNRDLHGQCAFSGVGRRLDISIPFRNPRFRHALSLARGR